MKTKGKYFVYFIAFLYIVGIFCGITYNVNSAFDGYYYYFDFSPYVSGTKNITQYDGTTKTFESEMRYPYGCLNGNYTINGTGGATRRANITIYKYTDELRFRMTATNTWFSSIVGQEIKYSFYSMLGKMFQVVIDGWGANTQYIEIKDSLGAIVYSQMLALSSVTGKGNFTIIMNTNNTYRFQLPDMLPFSAVNKCMDYGNFSNLSSVRISYSSVFGITAWFKLYKESFRIKSGIENPWENNSLLSIGSVTEETPFTNSITLIPSLPYLTIETLYTSHIDMNISEVAMQIVSNVDLNKFNSYLYINNMNCGNFDYYYLNGAYTIIKWKFSGVEIDGETLFEFCFSLKSGETSATIQWCSVDFDLDISGVISYRYANSFMVNGEFDATNFVDRDLCYKFWYLGLNISDGSCGIDLGNYTQYGNTHGTFWANSVDYLIYKEFNIPLNCTIRAVRLKVQYDMWYDDNVLTNYWLWVNEEEIGFPDCFGAINGEYYLTWLTDKTLTDEKPSFIFYHATYEYTYGYFWQVHTTEPGLDSDGDGLIGFYTSDDIGNLRQHYVASDLSYGFYIEPIEPEEEYTYPDTLDLNGWYSENSTGYKFHTWDDIICSYTLGDPAYDYTLECRQNYSNENYSYFPIDCSYPAGTTGFSAVLPGVYEFKLKSYHYVYNITAYVDSTQTNFEIGTVPSITDRFEEYRVFYRYYHEQGKDGWIARFDDFEDIDDIESGNPVIYIGTNITGNRSYSGDSIDDEWWGLFVNDSGIARLVDYCQHIIRDTTVYTNEISVSYNPIPIGNTQYTFGTHLFPGSDVYIEVNGNYLTSVSGSQVFWESFIVNVEGVNNVSLLLDQEGTIILLDNVQFISTGDGEAPPGGEPEDPWAFMGGYQYVFAIGIVVMFMILPMTVASRLGIELPMLANVGSATIGLSFCSLSGLLPLWVIFFTIVAMVTVAVIVMFR